LTYISTLNNDEVKLDRKAKKLILSVKDQYHDDISLIVKYLNINELRFDKEGVEQYLEYAMGVRENGRRYSANSYNKKISAIKNRIRYLFQKSPKSIDAVEKLKLEAYLDSMKYKKISPSDVAVTDEKLLTIEEIHILIDRADNRISLMIEFLSSTGCRISEMLNKIEELRYSCLR
jgi:site-specific recombinase XerD